MTAVEAVTDPWIPSKVSDRKWATLAARTPQLTATMRRYLAQLTTFLAPRSVDVADNALRQLARWLTDHTDVTAVADIGRSHFEDYKVWLAARPRHRRLDVGPGPRPAHRPLPPHRGVDGRRQSRGRRVSAFPRVHWTKIWSPNPLKRLNKEIKRRTRVLGIFPDQASVIRLVGAALADVHDEWQAGDRRYLSETSMTLLYPERDTDHVAELTPGD